MRKATIINSVLLIALVLTMLDFNDRLNEVEDLKCRSLYQLTVTEISSVKNDSTGLWSNDTITWSHPQLFVTDEEAEQVGDEGQIEFFLSLDEVDGYKPLFYFYSVTEI